jgi:LEA14-like dessication related protein
MEGAKLDKFGFSETLLTFTAKVENPNPFPLSVARVRFGILLEGKPAAQGQIDTAFAIPAATSEASPAADTPPPAGATPAPAPELVPGRGSITFPVAIRFGAVPGFLKVMAAQKEAAYALTGAVSFRSPAGVVDVPIQGGGMIPIPGKPDIQVARLQLRSASPKAVLLELRFKVGNTNGFPLPSAKIDYALHVGGKEIARATGRLDGIAPGESAELTVPIEISPFKVGKAAARFLVPFSSMKVELKGGFDFEGFPLPLDLDADVTKG